MQFNNMTDPAVIIGGIGGSGTRLVAEILKQAGVHIGRHINKPNDALWFSYFFNNEMALYANPTAFRKLAGLYSKGFQGGHNLTKEECSFINSLSRDKDIGVFTQRPSTENKKQISTFIDSANSKTCNYIWGWKAPASHIYADRFLKIWPNVRYIHVCRDGLDMAFSKNQNQVNIWGRYYSGGPYQNTPEDSLRYWCAVHKNIRYLKFRHPDRVMCLHFESLCKEPRKNIEKLLNFVGVDSCEPNRFELLVKPPCTIGRFKNYDTSCFPPEHTKFAKDFQNVINSF